MADKRKRFTIAVNDEDAKFLAQMEANGHSAPELMRYGIKLLRQYVEEAKQRGDPLFGK